MISQYWRMVEKKKAQSQAYQKLLKKIKDWLPSKIAQICRK